MVDVTDIRTFPFPTLADPVIQEVLTAVDVLRRESDRRGRQRSRFTEADRAGFQQGALSGESGRLDRVLATLDAIVQQNPASALTAAFPGPIGGLVGLVEGRDRKVGDLLRELAGAATRQGPAVAERRAGASPTAVEREIRARNERLTQSERESGGAFRNRTEQGQRERGRISEPNRSGRGR